MPEAELTSKPVLLVDDEPAVLTFMKRKLEQSGYPVMTAASGREALRIFRKAGIENSPRILAVLLDLNLADVRGFEVLQEMKKVQPLVPVIMVTGSHDEKEARRAIELGAMDYVTKPINFDQLFQLLALQR